MSLSLYFAVLCVCVCSFIYHSCAWIGISRLVNTLLLVIYIAPLDKDKVESMVVLLWILESMYAVYSLSKYHEA